MFYIKNGFVTDDSEHINAIFYNYLSCFSVYKTLWGKNMTQSRKITRNSMWPDTVVKMKYRTRYGTGLNSVATVQARIDNLSSKGMLVITDDLIPADTEVELQIIFSDSIGIGAIGKVLRNDSNGVALIFTQIDTVKLGECIMNRLNDV